VDLKISGCIDPGHVVGRMAKRYLFTNGIRMIPLTDDGLATAGPLVKAYDPGAIPMTGWSRISLPRAQAAAAGRLVLSGHGHRRHRRAGDGHMVIAARSTSIHGPWEHCPHNPLVRSRTAEPWWSRGHATLVEGLRGLVDGLSRL
jgi:xylan 1,4-beta-xylosidase